MRYSPWRDLAARPHITLGITRLPVGDGWWVPHRSVILLDDRLTRVERRCTLAHELRHVDHGDHQVAPIGPDGPRLARRQETRAEQAAARDLIGSRELVDALMAHPDDPAQAAEHLDVTVDVLAVRLAHLQPEERDALRAELARGDHAA